MPVPVASERSALGAVPGICAVWLPSPLCLPWCLAVGRRVCPQPGQLPGSSLTEVLSAAAEVRGLSAVLWLLLVVSHLSPLMARELQDSRAALERRQAVQSVVSEACVQPVRRVTRHQDGLADGLRSFQPRRRTAESQWPPGGHAPGWSVALCSVACCYSTGGAVAEGRLSVDTECGCRCQCVATYRPLPGCSSFLCRVKCVPQCTRTAQSPTAET